MPQLVMITLEFNDWNMVNQALYRFAGELAASEARRTGGVGYASGGVEAQVTDAHRIRGTIRAALHASNAEHAGDNA